eukprot:gb/GEZN01002702.1/.p1 GENE.gb/GEZN01002702.1/~~gb/GEZN01002702.1/.p1  ORF type:complete len:509 (+),score=75.79 gb/GEZN01002702.1/:475-2001(+)
MHIKPETPTASDKSKETKESPPRSLKAGITISAECEKDALSWFLEAPTPEWFQERSKFIPLRLDEDERKLLGILESAMDVSEYTDNIDIFQYNSKEKRIAKELSDIAGIISGLYLAADFRKGKAVLMGKEMAESESWLQHVFEVGRRHKIRNPEKMRDSYGKLLHALQDSQDADVQDLMGCSFVRKIRSVYDFLEDKDAMNVFSHPLLPIATTQIEPRDKTKEQVEALKQGKAQAVEVICTDVAKLGKLTTDDVRLVLASVGDNHSFLQSNRAPVDDMLRYLETYFHPDKPGKVNLTLRSGRDGSCLSHDHRTQYFFVYQSLTLWRDIIHDMFALWTYAESDMLDPQSPYRLRNTGQGLQRMQRCPRIGRAMSEIVHRCHQKMEGWVGLSVVHLGDRDVPNALVFIDKYNQVARILTPIVTCIRDLDRMSQNPMIKAYFDKVFGGVDTLRMLILSDFFKHGFDGSGDDGGSCIDGRLTSCWNWCSKITKKDYYEVFLLSGFVGFDGEF